MAYFKKAPTETHSYYLYTYYSFHTVCSKVFVLLVATLKLEVLIYVLGNVKRGDGI